MGLTPDECYAGPGDSSSPASSSSMNALGICLGCIGSLSINIGNNLQAKGHAEAGGGTSPMWRLGTAVFFLASIVQFAAFAFAPASIVAPLESLQFVANLAFAKWVNLQTITPRMYIGTVLILIGTVIAVSFGPRDSRAYAAGGPKLHHHPCAVHLAPSHEPNPLSRWRRAAQHRPEPSSFFPLLSFALTPLARRPQPCMHALQAQGPGHARSVLGRARVAHLPGVHHPTRGSGRARVQAVQAGGGEGRPAALGGGGPAARLCARLGPRRHPGRRAGQVRGRGGQAHRGGLHRPGAGLVVPLRDDHPAGLVRRGLAVPAQPRLGLVRPSVYHPAAPVAVHRLRRPQRRDLLPGVHTVGHQEGGSFRPGHPHPALRALPHAARQGRLQGQRRRRRPGPPRRTGRALHRGLLLLRR